MCILKVFILINNQLLSTANAEDINTDYYVTNKVSWICSVQVGKETHNKIRGFDELFRMLVKLRSLHKMLVVNFFFQIHWYC